MSKLEVTASVAGRERAVLVLAGELDISSYAVAERELSRVVADGAMLVVLDLRNLTFMDSTGLRFIVTADRQVRAQGKQVVLVPGPERVHRVFQITDLESRLEFAGDPTELLRPPEPEGPRPERQLTLSLPCDPAAVAAARHSLAELVPALNGDEFDNLELLVSELVTNSVRHAGLTQGDEIVLEVRVWPRMIRAEVCDTGRGFEPRQPQGGDERVGGWGLFIVQQLSDRWGVDTTGPITRVWLEMDRALATQRDSSVAASS